MTDITVTDLQIMSSAVNYRRWLFDQVAGYRGRRILEVGAGIGNYTGFLSDAEQIVSIDIHTEALAVLREKYGNDLRVAIHHADIADASCRGLASYRCDTAICFNVLEHVEDHVGATSKHWWNPDARRLPASNCAGSALRLRHGRSLSLPFPPLHS